MGFFAHAIFIIEKWLIREWVRYMLSAEQLLVLKERSEKDFLTYFKCSYADVDAWIREYDKWYRNESGQVSKIYSYKLLDCTFVTPSEAAHVEYNKDEKVKAVQIKTKIVNDRPIAECCEGFYEGIDFVENGEPFEIPFDRCFPIFVEMLEAYDNLIRLY